MEYGSDLEGQYIEIRSGRYDGARGTVKSVDWIDGKRHISVLLDGGDTIVIVQPGPEQAQGGLPRELGS